MLENSCAENEVVPENEGERITSSSGSVIVAPRCRRRRTNDHDDNLSLADIANKQQSPQEVKEEKQSIKEWSNTPTQ